MLVLSRKCGQSVCIGNDITITFLRVQGKTAKIGIDAPSIVHVLRGELCVGGLAESVVGRIRANPVALAAE